MQRGHVIVVGGGLIGLFSALRLAQDGWEVTLLEGESLGSGAAQGNGGWVCPALSKPLAGPGMIAHTVAQTFARDAAMKMHLPPRRATVDWVARFVRHCTPAHLERTWAVAARLSEYSAERWDRLGEWGIDVPVHREGFLFLYRDRAEAEAGLAGAEAVRELGQPVPERLLSGAELRELEPGLSAEVEAGYLWPEQGYVDPPALVRELVRAVREAGVQVVEQASVERVEEDLRGGPEAVTVHAAGRTYRAHAAVVATGAGIAALLRPLGLRVPVIAGKGYSFDVATETPWTHALSIPGPHVVGTPLADGRLRMAGIMELDRDPHRLNRGVVRRIARAAAPYLTGVDWTERRNEWVGARPITPDTLPVLGPVRPGSRVVVAGGHGTMGVTQGPGTAEIVRGLLAGADDLPGWLAQLAPGRFAGSPLRSVTPTR